MNARYQKTVFDEWALVALSDNRARLLAYLGPRQEGFLQNFMRDAGVLRGGLMRQGQHVGDYEFARQSVGTGFESYMAVGEGLYLICNNTVQSMDSIAKDPLWLSAQVPFVELSETVLADPVVE